MTPVRTRSLAAAATAALALAGAAASPALAAHGRTAHVRQSGTTGGGTNMFSVGELQSSVVGAPGCGTNYAGEPSVHVSKANLVEVASEDGLGGGSEFWRATQVGGSTAANACQLVYSGQPNAVAGVGASGGDVDTAIAPVKSSVGTYRIYVASLNLASVNVAVSNDNGATFSQFPVQAGLPVDDREWIAAYGADTSLLSYHDITTNDIDILRSDSGGGPYTQISQAIPPTDYKAQNNELGNLVIDHNSGSGTSTSPFYAYQSFVAPSTPSGTDYNEAWVAVSADGGHSWTDRPVGCSVSSTGLDHNFPNVSVAPNGNLWYAWSDNKSVYTATSSDHGSTWTCSGPVSSGSAQAIYPWIDATSNGVDLVYYGATSGPSSSQLWYADFVQDLPNPTTGVVSVTGWGAPTQVVAVHQGQVCEGGISCTGGRQLYDDFGVDTDQSGWAHIAYSHDSPTLGGSGTYTGYAVQTAGTPVGAPN